jgi:hypothetical protein
VLSTFSGVPAFRLCCRLDLDSEDSTFFSSIFFNLSTDDYLPSETHAYLHNINTSQLIDLSIIVLFLATGSRPGIYADSCDSLSTLAVAPALTETMFIDNTRYSASGEVQTRLIDREMPFSSLDKLHSFHKNQHFSCRLLIPNRSKQCL